MNVKSKMLFVLIGNPGTGKTVLQKILIEKICQDRYRYGRLPVNQIYNIAHPEIKRKYINISIGNRSYQEKPEYISVENYFQHHFQQADIAFISSHLFEADVAQIIEHGHRLFYNVYGIFWSNSIIVNHPENSQISALNWDERLIIENPAPAADEATIDWQLNLIAENLVTFIVNRTSIS